MELWKSKEQKRILAQAEHEELERLREQLASDKAAGKKRDDVAYWRAKQLEQKYPDTRPGYDPVYYKYGPGAGLIKLLERGIERQRLKAEAARARRDALKAGSGQAPSGMAQEREQEPVRIRGVAAPDDTHVDGEADAKRRLAEKFGK